MITKNIFIIGSNGIPANYGGFETFVENLTAYKIDENIKYHVACLAKDNKEFEYNNARCFNVNVPNIGAAKAEYYDLVALEKTIKYIKKNNIQNAIVYVLGTGVGLFIWLYKKRLHKLNAQLYVNPDGLEWTRDKWNSILKKFFKICEKKMAKNADLLICDSVNIENYMKKTYMKYKPNTTFIAYGSNVQTEEHNEKEDQQDSNQKLNKWYEKNKLQENEYYLIVGRFVPENNYETMIKEFMKTSTDKDLVIITNVEKNKFYSKLQQETNFEKDKRIKFVGTAEELISKIEFTKEEQTAKENGKNIDVYLEVKDISNSVSESDKKAIEEKLENDTIGLYLDINLLKQVEGQDATKITETKEPITITFEIPEKLINTDSNIIRTYKILRLHEGKVDTLDVTVNGTTATFKTDEFSTYALAYTDKDITKTDTAETTSSPKTGDNIIVYAVMFIISTLGIAVISANNKKTRRTRR